MKITNPPPQTLTEYAPSDARIPQGALVKRVDKRAKTGLFDYYIVGPSHLTNLRTGTIISRGAEYRFVIVDHSITISN